MDIEAYRFTEEDESAITARITETVRMWQDIAVRGARSLGWSDLPALERVAHHALGCSSYDLRVVELDWVTVQCQHALALVVPV